MVPDNNYETLLNRISINKDLMGGRPTIRGMRFPVKDILEMLSSGMSWNEILEQHPVLEPEDIQAALLFAVLKLENSFTINAA